MRINNKEELEREGLFITTDIEDGLLDKRIKDFIKEKAKYSMMKEPKKL